MSAIAQRKAAQEKGAETIFIYMGYTFLITAVINILIILIVNNGFSLTNMTPFVYFLMMTGLSFGMGSYLREHNHDLKHFKDWFYSFIVIGIIVAAILGAYQF